jgi:hypothetical protein
MRQWEQRTDIPTSALYRPQAEKVLNTLNDAVRDVGANLGAFSMCWLCPRRKGFTTRSNYLGDGSGIYSLPYVSHLDLSFRSAYPTRILTFREGGLLAGGRDDLRDGRHADVVWWMDSLHDDPVPIEPPKATPTLPPPKPQPKPPLTVEVCFYRVGGRTLSALSLSLLSLQASH